jgi:membrane-associated protease RseP (regulator of RpoE activity)
MAFLQDFALFLAALAAWGVAMALLARTAWFKRWNLGLSLFILMVRTVRGRELLDRIAQRRVFWRAFGAASVTMVLLAMAGITALLAWEATIVWNLPASARPTPDLLLGIPGLNRAIPLWYGIFGLAVAIVLHEFAHGILARASNIRVLSLGILLVYLPIGAFVEPDEDQLKAAPRRERMRLYAAGPATNLFLAAAFFLSFTLAFAPAVAPYEEGAGILYAQPGGPAHGAGIVEGWVITSLNDTAVTDQASLQEVLARTQANQTAVNVTACLRGSCRSTAVNLSYREAADGRFIGRLNVSTTDVVASPFTPWSDRTDPLRGLLGFISLPFSGSMPVQAPYTEFYRVTGAWASVPAPLFWVLGSAAYWLFWLNLMLGATNALPAIPLDGGFLFRDAVRGLLDRASPARPPEWRDRVAHRLTVVSSVLVLFLIVWQFAGSYVSAWLSG